MRYSTKNSVDRSIAIVDYAIRRRFLFVELMPNEEILDQYLKDPKNNIEIQFAEEIIEFYRSLNTLIAKNKKLGRHHQIDHTYFFIKDWNEFHVIWIYKIMPLIEEYLDMDSDRIYDFLEDLRKELLTVVAFCGVLLAVVAFWWWRMYDCLCTRVFPGGSRSSKRCRW